MLRNNAIGIKIMAGRKTLTIAGMPEIGINIITMPPNRTIRAIDPHLIACREMMTASLVTNNGITITSASKFIAIDANRAYQ